MRLLHGMRDADVPWRTSQRIAERLAGEDVRITLVKDGDHRLSREQDIALLCRTGSLELAWVAAGRLDAWIQPDTDPWDWLPGALLVTEAGGVARVVAARDALARRRLVSAG